MVKKGSALVIIFVILSWVSVILASEFLLAQRAAEVSRQTKDYFPLAVGNRWTYKVLIPPEGRHPFSYYEFKFAKESSRFSVVSKKFPAPAGEWEVTFTVARRSEKGDFQVEVKGCEQGRVPRYEYLAEGFTVGWNIVRQENNPLAIVEKLTGIAKYSLTRDKIESEMFFGLLIPDSKLSPSGKEREKSKKTPTWQIESKVISGAVTVPSGIFYNCLSNIWSLPGNNEEKDLHSADAGFTIERIFAEGVGLISEIQRDAAGDIRYKMELISSELDNGAVVLPKR
ncbi:MAG: hypothetical protein QME90_01595 [Thermodesulfobacteriota bacterium]|nr:hypothetical protein [Thermodesulfobacteriota bacterium]